MLDYSLIETGFGFNQEIVVKGSLGESYRFSSKGPLQATTQPKAFSHLNEATFFLRRYCIGGSGSIISQLYATFANDPAPWQHDLDEQIDGLSRLLMSGQFFAYSTEVRAPVPEHIKPNMPLAGTAAKMEGISLSRSASSTLGTGGETSKNLVEDLDLYCTLPDGSPAADLPYTVTMADGTVLKGTLDKKGEKHLPNLKPNSVDVEFGEKPDEAAITATRNQISSLLDSIIADEQAEAAELSEKYKNLSAVEARQLVGLSEFEGMKKAGELTIDAVLNLDEVFASLRKPAAHLSGDFSYHSDLGRLGRMLEAAWGAFNADDKSWGDSFNSSWSESEHQAYIQHLKATEYFTITRQPLVEAYEIASFICDDPETRALFTKFTQDYISAQHYTEVAEMSGFAVFEVTLGALTGAGTTAATSAAVRKLPALGKLLKKLNVLLKNKKKYKTKSGHTGGRVEQKIGKPDGAEVPSAANYKPKEGFTPLVGNDVHKRYHPDGHQPDPNNPMDRGDPYTLQADGKPMGAKEGVMPKNAKGLKELDPEYQRLIEEKGYPDIVKKKDIRNFSDIQPTELKEGDTIYRIIDEKANSAGSYWTRELPASKTEWRDGYAVKDSWNDNGYYVEHTVGKDGLKAWDGTTAGQQYDKFNGNDFYLEGGQQQLFIERDVITGLQPQTTNWTDTGL
jgi:hypothetical protein